jgi:hypothetical protein
MLANPANSAIILINVACHTNHLPDSLTKRRRERLSLLAAGAKLFQLKPLVIGGIDASFSELASVAVPINANGLQIWRDESIASLIAATETAVPCIGGCWLNEEVLLAAVQGVALGYDIRLLADVSFAKHAADRSIAFDRLAQHGVLVTTVHQMLLEWAVTLDDPAIQRKVQILLS